VLANTEELHEKIIQLQDRISSLENALGTLQAAHSSQPHPLLREDLLDLKAPLGTELAPNLKRRRTEDSDGAEQGQEPEVLDALGTLTIESEGRSVFYGGTAGAEFLLKVRGSVVVRFGANICSARRMPRRQAFHKLVKNWKARLHCERRTSAPFPIFPFQSYQRRREGGEAAVEGTITDCRQGVDSLRVLFYERDLAVGLVLVYD
jgi:hypothetical protein